MDKGRAYEPDESSKSMHESSDREDGSDEETSFEEPSPPEISCAKRQRVEIPDRDYNPNDELEPGVPNNDKETSWNSLSAIYRFPPELYERGKAATLKTMGRCLRTFRNTLKNNFVDKGVTLFKRYGFITPDDWKKFVVKASFENFK
ncbi:transposon protein, putative, CACTA, En/Spm sub-class [Panicum miliaceum]|uniref:Transposon protein, putative, CACTA, En/Spm sub-class n=1 Tax=Panicum miliaceum TaxID=4540 RepID=A0A3L6TMF4_PANMI|nr:transposon protein, putative, CACTA, En/Spm sub-class [Panicum miliaceum]